MYYTQLTTIIFTFALVVKVESMPCVMGMQHEHHKLFPSQTSPMIVSSSPCLFCFLHHLSVIFFNVFYLLFLRCSFSTSSLQSSSTHYAYNSFKVAFLPYWCIATIVLMLLCDIFQFRLCCLWGNWLSPLFCCQAGDKGVDFFVVCFLSTLRFFLQKSFLHFLYFLLFLFLTWRFSFVFLLARKVGVTRLFCYQISNEGWFFYCMFPPSCLQASSYKKGFYTSFFFSFLFLTWSWMFNFSFLLTRQLVVTKLFVLKSWTMKDFSLNLCDSNDFC
jgi:hypothetical protein